MILLAEHFDGNLDDWTQHDESDATTSAPGVWVINSDDELTQTANIFGSNDGVRRPGTFLIYDNGASWSLYTLTVQMIGIDNDHLGFMVYYQDEDNYVQFRMSNQAGEAILWKKVAGVQTEMASSTFTPTLTEWYFFEAIVEAATLTISRNGNEMFGGPVALSGLASGTVALFCSGNDNTIFDDVVVKENTPSDEGQRGQPVYVNRPGGGFI